MPDRHGMRGYIGSRPYFGSRAPQHIQNLVIRDYCKKLNRTFLLSATEYAMPNCFMVLDRVFNELPKVEGIVLYSLFMLPRARAHRERLWNLFRQHGGSIHSAVEGFIVETEDDIHRIEVITRLQRTLEHCPTKV